MRSAIPSVCAKFWLAIAGSGTYCILSGYNLLSVICLVALVLGSSYWRFIVTPQPVTAPISLPVVRGHSPTPHVSATTRFTLALDEINGYRQAPTNVRLVGRVTVVGPAFGGDRLGWTVHAAHPAKEKDWHLFRAEEPISIWQHWSSGGPTRGIYILISPDSASTGTPIDLDEILATSSRVTVAQLDNAKPITFGNPDLNGTGPCYVVSYENPIDQALIVNSSKGFLEVQP